MFLSPADKNPRFSRTRCVDIRTNIFGRIIYDFVVSLSAPYYSVGIYAETEQTIMDNAIFVPIQNARKTNASYLLPSTTSVIPVFSGCGMMRLP